MKRKFLRLGLSAGLALSLLLAACSPATTTSQATTPDTTPAVSSTESAVDTTPESSPAETDPVETSTETEPAETEPAETPTETEPAETEPAEAVSGELTLGLPGEFQVTDEGLVRAFEEANPDLKLTVDMGPWGDYTKKIQTQLASGIAPDIWFQENAAILGYGAKGVAEDLAGRIASDLDASQYSPALFAAQLGDAVYGVPHGINNIALVFNKDLFDKQGVDYPTNDWTYDDLYEAAKQLTHENDDGQTVYGYLYQGSITTGWIPFGRSQGGQILNEDKTAAVLDDKFWAGIEMARNIVAEGISADSTTIGELGGGRKIFGNELAAMAFLQYSEIESVIKKDFPDLNWDSVMIPKGSDGERLVPSVTNSWLIYSRADEQNKDNAWAFLRHYLSPESQATLAASGATIPVENTALDALQTLDGMGYAKAYTDGMDFAITLEENPAWSAWRGVLQAPVLDYTNGQRDLSDDERAEVITAIDEAISNWNEENIVD